MTGSNRISKGLLCAFLSYLMPIMLVRCLLVLAAIRCLKEERRELVLLRPLILMMTAYRLADVGLLLWLEKGLAGRSLFLDLIVTAAELYFHFQFLADLAALAGKYRPKTSLESDILARRTFYIVLYTFHILLSWLAENGIYMLLFQGAVMIFMLAAGFSIDWALFQLWQGPRQEANIGLE